MKWSIPEKIIERGREYAAEGRVVAIEPDMDSNVWHAEVLGSELYEVTLDGTAKELDECSCPFWQQRGYCKHTVAVELALREKGYSRILKLNDSLPVLNKKSKMSKAFMKSFAGLQEKEIDAIDAKPLRVEFMLENMDLEPFQPERALLVLQLRLGYRGKGHRIYQVKNIGEFLIAYEKQTSYELKKELLISLNKTCFRSEDRKLLDMAVTFYQSMQMNTASLDLAAYRVGAKNLILPKNGAEDFVKWLIDAQQLQLKLAGETFSNVTFQETGLLPMEFYVRPFQNGFTLVVESSVSYYWLNYGWIFTGKKFQKISEEQAEVYQMLLHLMKRMKKPEVQFYQEDIGGLFSYVLPMLRSLGPVCIEGDVQTEMIQTPLTTKLYFRKSRSLLRVRVDFLYEDIVFSTDKRFEKQQKKSQFVLRDVKGERKILHQLEKFYFEKGETTYRKAFPAGQDLYHFFYQELPRLRQQCEVVLEDSLANLLLDASQYPPEIAVTENDSWLDFHFNIEGIEEAEVNDLFLHLLNNEDFYQMKNGALLPLDSLEFQQTSEALAKIRQRLAYKDGTFRMSRYEGIQVQAALGTMENAHFSDEFGEMVKYLTQPATFPAQLPKTLQADLRDYQKYGFHWLKMLSYYQFGGILADEMGLGKTLQAIAFLLSEKNEKPTLAPFLIVAPASLIFNWQMEIKKFAPTLKAVVVTGNKKERLEKAQADADVYITSYAGLRQDLETYQEKNLSILIIDEAQMVKNASTKTAHAVKELKVQQRFALSGTPIENSLEELWTIFQLVMPGFLPSKKKYSALSPQEVANLIRPFVLRREKTQVLKDLPDKIETNLYSSLTENQKTLYLAYLRKMQAQVGGMASKDFQKNQLSILAGLTRLRQICCDPRLCEPDYEGDSGKLEQLKELVVKALANRRRILIFSQFTSMLSLIEKELKTLGLTAFYLRGSTKPKERMELVTAFNQGQQDIFLISLKAGGTGLNLTGADTVILYDLWWNPAVEEQATGRAHRMGQEKVVEVWRLIAEGTIEEKIDRLQQEKKELFQQVLMADEGQKLQRLSEADIREILNLGVEM